MIITAPAAESGERLGGGAPAPEGGVSLTLIMPCGACAPYAKQSRTPFQDMGGRAG